jgi:hypothetical protein
MHLKTRIMKILVSAVFYARHFHFGLTYTMLVRMLSSARHGATCEPGYICLKKTDTPYTTSLITGDGYIDLMKDIPIELEEIEEIE